MSQPRARLIDTGTRRLPAQRLRLRLQYRVSSGAVPAGTRTIVVTLQMTRDGPPEFTHNDGYGDDLSLVLLP